ncbi:hypothetical protein PLESTB_001151800 [Pleodorina starrii]|uniref:C-factor n=1 Tax=Pleodorina starrii TaxID=330485 RepID=A0A9W6BRJ0_9CHLO|nr:hypothetical protein PLESTM_001783800 [Pleodorina starrii]GLC56813.1 hypothetical protein PLESTB_001151800 [Pleodorina starrii]GLC68149.1 hypothetical protein PLESTF_000653700 [Pleodorina starrii]
MAQPITGKTVVVTGGSRGIGLGLVKKFLARNNTVIATSRKSSEAQHLHALHQQFPERLIMTDLDTTAKASIASWAAHVKSAGVKHVDVLVNNAGLYGRRLQLSEFEEEDFLLNFKANSMGPFFVVQQLLQQELLGSAPDRPDGASLVANISSIMGSNTDPTVSAVTRGGFAYRSSKAALNAISSTLARDLEPQGITVVALHPGYVRTDLTGGNGWIDVEESTAGLMAVMESGKPLSGRFLSYNGEEIPW